MDEGFLIVEYKSTYEQLRYYDDRQSKLLTLLISISSLVSTAYIALPEIFKKDVDIQLDLISLSSFIVFISILLIFFALVQNRLYFVYCARQINAIRKYYLDKELEKDGFKNNQMYSSTDFPAFKIFSVHSIMIYGVILISSTYLSISSFTFFFNNKNRDIITAVIFFSIMTLQILFFSYYLIKKGKKSADKAIHGKSL